jgi:hypothetical protein
MFQAENDAMIRWLAGQSPEARHFAALYLNWDYAMPCLEWLLAREDCDLATPVAFFWLANPEEFLQYPSRDSVIQAQGDVATFDLLNGVVTREAHGFYPRRQISRNPAAFGRPDLYDSQAARCSIENLPWTLPTVFRDTFKGIEVDDSAGRARYLTGELRTLLKALGTNIPASF